MKRRRVLGEKSENILREKVGIFEKREETVILDKREESLISSHHEIDRISSHHEMDNFQDFSHNFSDHHENVIVKEKRLEIKYSTKRKEKSDKITDTFIFREIRNKLRDITRSHHTVNDIEIDNFPSEMEYPRNDEDGSLLLQHIESSFQGGDHSVQGDQTVQNDTVNFNTLNHSLSRQEKSEMFFSLLVSIERGNVLVNQESCYGEIIVQRMAVIV